MYCKKTLQSKENTKQTLKAKIGLFGFVLILAFVGFFMCSMKVEAASSTVTGTMFDKNGNGQIDADSEVFSKVDVESGSDMLTYVQGNGEDDKTSIKFTINDFPSDATSIAIVESDHSDSSNDADLDKYNKDAVAGTWTASPNNVTKNNLGGSIAFSEDENGVITADVVYRLRKATYGLKYLKVFFYNGNQIEESPSSSITVFYVIAKPINMVGDTVEAGTTCTTKGDKICTNYVNGSDTREARELKLFIPSTVAFNYNVVEVVSTFNDEKNTYVVSNYTEVVAGSTVYAINYFLEATDGTVTPVSNPATANRSYMYTNFEKSGLDTTEVVEDFFTNKNGNYSIYLDTYMANEIDYISIDVDSMGMFFFYLRDIFGNEKLVKQRVTDVKNRAIITEIKKSNASATGYGADETFTNESVAVTIKMTVETHFQYGICLNGLCTEIINLTKDNVSKIKYWRVDVKVQDGVDLDAYVAGKAVTDNYASESYAAIGSMHYLFCKSASVCAEAEIQKYNSLFINSENGAGYASFDNNVLTMYIATNGRYRFYIEDTAGNNTWGSDTDRNVEEYRNPRVEVYAIDKHAPEITFNHTNVEVVGGADLKSFDVETYEYYTAIEQAIADGKFEYDGRIAGTEPVAGIIDRYVYYPLVRDNGRSVDVSFTNDKAIKLSKVIASEYVYYYDVSKDLYADYSTYDREANQYALKLYGEDYYDNSIATIMKNAKHNSNGLKLVDGKFEFKEINYYHKDGVNRVCTQISNITGYEEYADKAELDCVNYYIDHGVDFIIEFVAEDSVGNVSSSRVYVNIVDTTPAGFTMYADETDAIKSSNIGTDCRMEIGQEIGFGKVQNKGALLNCYNIILNDNYNFEDNVYNPTVSDGLKFINNRINNNDHVKIYMKSDKVDAGGNVIWIDLETATFIPNKTGYYDMKVELHDDTIGESGTNVLTVLVSYYVDRKIVLIEPLENAKFYGDGDPTFDYCVYIDVGNHYDVRFSDNPYDPTKLDEVYTKIYCSNSEEADITSGKRLLFRDNNNSDFFGKLSRLESSWYNQNLSTPILLSGTSVGVENNYVGDLYRVILGTLNINMKVDGTTADDDYIVKIHPSFREDTKYKGTANDNLVTNSPLEDDDKFSQSNVKFTIKQVIIEVTASGGEKNYGEKDDNHSNFNDDSASDKYLNGFVTSGESAVRGLINDGVQYTDTTSIILGVLRREVGENVGRYAICNYRGADLDDNVLETTNNMYLNCIDMTSAGFVYEYGNEFEDSKYLSGILQLNGDYIKSRALYIATNKSVVGRTLNVTTDARNNKYANYVIKYVGADYDINPIDLVIQAAPGQRREYNYTNTYDPNPWEIILYGLVDGDIKKDAAGTTFNGYTDTIIDGDYYGVAKENEKDRADGSAASKVAANFSENRTTWYLYHDGELLTGYKTNETYELLRDTTSGTAGGSAKLMREPGKNGGWYLYEELANDLNVVTGVGDEVNSNIAVVTNGREQCNYDSTGHVISDLNGETLCKNYNLVYNPYYTTDDGYTYVNKGGHTNDADFIYKSNGKTCTTLDEDMPCTNTIEEPNKIYKIQFEIYRREIIMEFNSAIETIKTSNTETWDIFYGKRYNFYKTNLFDINFYTGKNFYPENYLFICYQNESTKSNFDPTNATTTGCSGDSSYGLTHGDTWRNIGLSFEMHTLVSDSGSAYYDDEDSAIPAGVYYIYADIDEEQKKNYRFTYYGGSLTIKSLAVEVVITSYLKEYGEAYLSKYGSGADYNSFASFADSCMLDGFFVNSNVGLISLGDGVYCNNADEDFGNTIKNIYGFYINGLDSKDTISGNFIGRPFRSRSVSALNDENALQDNVGTYTINKGSIASTNNNPFENATNACSMQVTKGDYGDCVVMANRAINNYIIYEETKSYSFKMHTEDKNATVETPDRTLVEGTMVITPAQLTITVSNGQTKMYGCAYNAYNTNQQISVYDYDGGYSNCVETDGNYYDLGYKYIVSGDKDYQIANYGFDYETNDSYEVSGIYGSTTFRPTTKTYGVRAHALNAEGTLYRIPDSTANRAGVSTSSFVAAAISAQASVSKGYQGQTVGTYIITLGNVDALLNEARGSTYVNACNVNNMPDTEGGHTCKNYNINYYGTGVYNPIEGETNKTQQYLKDGAFPTDLLFTVTKRKAYVYTNYDQKIYGEVEPDVRFKCGDYNMDGEVDENDEVTAADGSSVNGDIYYGFCTQAQVDVNKNVDNVDDYIVDYGITRYYTKYNSLAKAPWNGIVGRNDVQTDVLTGKISRKGMNDNPPAKDDIKGYYEYVYDNETYYGTVHLIGDKAGDSGSYGKDNYLVNYYESGLAVNEFGQVANADSEAKPIKFEIVLRKIKVAFVSFGKVYGERDDVKDYNILVCAPSESFDFGNMRCTGKDPTDKHGLSKTHLDLYTEDGLLKQSDFKTAFLVRFIRVLGENVSCGTSTSVDVQLTGFFFGENSEVSVDGTEYTKTLSCNNTLVSGKSVYETLAYIDQGSSSVPGYNYEANYTIGYVNITPRPILITPTAGQGFTYGDYHGSLIPAIEFSQTLVRTPGDGLLQEYGLVHDQGGSNGVCLNNINYYNNGPIDGVNIGTCFYINDRQDVYDSGSNMTTSRYVVGAVNSNTGLANINGKNYVFGDIYESENSTRSALNRGINSSLVERYNRNVGVYTINIGDLKDQTGNYALSFTSGVEYTITVASVSVAPETNLITGTSQSNQYKIYGEPDKELTFQVTTVYTVRTSHYAKYNSNIINITSASNVVTLLADITRYSYNASTKLFEESASGAYIYVTSGDRVMLNGYAYDENGGDSDNLNYGQGRDSKKQNTVSVDQAAVTGSKYYDTVCSGVDENVGCNLDRSLSYGETDRVLLGYLYVENYAQGAGEYYIKNGFKVAKNEWAQENYSLSVDETVRFTIIPRPVGVQIQNVVKTYGQTTDSISCEYIDGTMISCQSADGVLMDENEYLRYNFDIEHFSGGERIESILNNYTYGGVTYNNSILYFQNSTFVNGLVPLTQRSYSVYGTGEDKNSEHLGVYVSRDERNNSNATCLYNGDTYGFCEDAGVYFLRFYGYLNTIDSITANNYNSIYKPGLTAGAYSGLVSSVEKYYYNSYFGYNPNYFVIVVQSDTVADSEDDEVAVADLFSASYPSTSRKAATGSSEQMLKATGTLTINPKVVNLYVNTSFFGSRPEIYKVAQNTTAPSLPVIDNSLDLKYNIFYGNGEGQGREPAVYGDQSYGKIIWGAQPSAVRTGDKLAGEIAYCNKIISSAAYNSLRQDGITSDYTCLNLAYEGDRNSVLTNDVGFVPIVRDINRLSIVNALGTSAGVDTNANPTYENTNYVVTFYPGGLEIIEDGVAPTVQVNRDHVYIEANAVGTYDYECVGSNNTTTYTNCDLGLSIIGKTDGSHGDPILDWIHEVDDNGVANYSKIIKLDLPKILGCEDNEYECTTSAFLELTYGRGKTNFTSSGGIVTGIENALVEPFTLQKDTYIKNAGPATLKEFIITLIDWFGVTAYDPGEIKNGQLLDKKFDKYWYLIIEEQGTNGAFDISRVGEYKIHFYVMDNAGNVSADGNVGTLHIIDTTKPVVGTLNLYNGKVKCTSNDCTKEDNWVVAQDTYLPINTVYRYDALGNPDIDGDYIIVGDNAMVTLSSQTRYSRTLDALGAASYVEDNSQGKYIKINANAKAIALKHYSWSNSPNGIYLTITGGSDNSYTDTSFATGEDDISQWNHYFSRDGGTTWFLYDRTAKDGYKALDAEGTREILIKAVDSGVKINSAEGSTKTYVTKYYDASNVVTASMTYYTFVDTSSNDTWLKAFAEMTAEEQAANDATRHDKIAAVGWNISDAAENDVALANKISLLTRGIKASLEPSDPPETIVSNYKFYRDRQTAYLDRTNPVVTFSSNNGEKLYVYEYGCAACTKGYEEKYSEAMDSYPLGYTSLELQSNAFDKNNSILLNHDLFTDSEGNILTGYQGSYTSVSQEQLITIRVSGGLGSTPYVMGGDSNPYDIRDVHTEERRYIIYAFNDSTNVRTVYDLSALIPTSYLSTIGESNIYNVIANNLTGYAGGDYTFTISYSVIDKAGNESVHISRGVIFVDLIPIITPVVGDNIEMNVVDNNTYVLDIEQGDSVEDIISSLSVSAGTKVEDLSQYITQTVYYNGEMLMDNKRYNKNIVDGFTTSVPGVYEITYNVQYMHYGSNGEKELISADPVKLIIRINATNPIVDDNLRVNLATLIPLIFISSSIIFIGIFISLRKKRS